MVTEVTGDIGAVTKAHRALALLASFLRHALGASGQAQR